MNKSLIYLGIIIGGLVGSYLATILLNTNGFSVSNVTFGTLGSLIGIWVAVKLGSSDY